MTAHTRLWSWLWREKVSNRRTGDTKPYIIRKKNSKKQNKTARNKVKQQEMK